MYPMLLHAHSGWRYLVLLILSITLLKLIIGLVGKKKWLIWDSRLMLWSLIAVDIQILMGIPLVVMTRSWHLPLHMEHMTVMVLAAIVLHVGRRLILKTRVDAARFRRATICVVGTLLLISLGVYRITAT